MKRKPLVYLAGPYTHKEKEVMEAREDAHGRWAGRLLKAGYLIYSPIAETASIARVCDMMDTDWDTWREKDLRALEVHDEMWIIPLPGYLDSVGLRGEIKFCIQNSIPISIIDENIEAIMPISTEDLLKQLKVKSVNSLKD